MCGRQADIRHLPRGVRTGARAVRTAGPAAPPEWRDPDEHCPSYSKSPGWNSPELLPHCALRRRPLCQHRPGLCWGAVMSLLLFRLACAHLLR
uniref:Uncharacterized protein n=1 Tax=Equus asinus TaxID=9793 RepID=A0A9L0JKW5_EQUAS